jgi:allantoinase
MNADLVIRGRNVVTPGGIKSAAVAVTDGAIQVVAEVGSPVEAATSIGAGDDIVMPGVIDTHVHINEPGRTDWEGFVTATRAAAAGGVTCMIEMPLNSIPTTTTADALEKKFCAAQDKLCVDVGFWGGVVPGNTDQLPALFNAGAFGFKCFLVPSGVPEFEHVTEADLRQALPVLKELGALLLVHAELPAPIAEAERSAHTLPRTHYATWLGSRPAVAENEAIAMLTGLAREFRSRIHVVHVSSADALACLQQAQREGVPISAETCPHYLTLTAEEIPDGATEYKCAPPIRERANQQQLWSGLRSGVLSLVVSDHSPCPPEMKCREAGDFIGAWGGIASLELGLPLLWTAAQDRGFSIRDLARWMCEAPAQLAGLSRKGRIAPGCDADFVIWDSRKTFRVEACKLHQRHKMTPYAGRELAGVIKQTIVRGNTVFRDGEFSPYSGRVLRRGEA